MAWWQRTNGGETVAREYATAIYVALREVVATKAVTRQGMIQILGMFQAKLAASDAPRLAPKSTLRLISELAELLSALNADQAEYEQSFLGRVDQRLLELATSPDPE